MMDLAVRPRPWGALILCCLPPVFLGAAAIAGAAFAQQHDAALPPDAEYVTVRDGPLTLAGERVRFWGAVGGFPAGNTRDNEPLVQRLHDLGFNMVRYWCALPNTDYVKGDGSEADRVDAFLYYLKQRGMKAWLAGLNHVGKAMPGDVDVLDDPGTREAWREAVGPDGLEANCLARVWDPRLEAITIQRRRQILDHVNQYTGLRWGDDPVFAIFELSNEEWWLRRMMQGSLERLPRFFQDALRHRFNDWLRQKYGDEEALRVRWLGLRPGESLAERTIAVAPLGQPGDLAFGGGAVNPGTEEFNGHRASDVLEFMTGIWVASKQREHEAVKQMGQAARLAPLVWDTGIGNQIQSQYLQQHADAIAHCTYLHGLHPNPKHPRHPWYSGLEQQPSLNSLSHWVTVEHNRYPGKPYFLYETQIHNPAKYRMEYPMRVAAIGAIQDWDVVIWHYYDFAVDITQPHPYDSALDYTGDTGHIQGLHYQFDEVQMSSMLAAGQVFRQGLLEAARNPTTMIFGRRSLFDPGMVIDGSSQWMRIYFNAIYDNDGAAYQIRPMDPEPLVRAWGGCFGPGLGDPLTDLVNIDFSHNYHEGVIPLEKRPENYALHPKLYWSCDVPPGDYIVADNTAVDSAAAVRAASGGWILDRAGLERESQDLPEQRGTMGTAGSE